MIRTVRLYASFEFEQPFTAHELEPNLDGIAGDLLPTDEAMQALVIRLDEVLRQLSPRRIELDLAGPIHNATGISTS